MKDELLNDLSYNAGYNAGLVDAIKTFYRPDIKDLLGLNNVTKNLLVTAIIDLRKGKDLEDINLREGTKPNFV